MPKLKCYNCDHKWEGRENSRKCPKCGSDDIGFDLNMKTLTAGTTVYLKVFDKYVVKGQIGWASNWGTPNERTRYSVEADGVILSSAFADELLIKIPKGFTLISIKERDDMRYKEYLKMKVPNVCKNCGYWDCNDLRDDLSARCLSDEIQGKVFTNPNFGCVLFKIMEERHV